MFQEQPAPPELKPCCACDAPGLNGFWGSQLCDECYGAWVREAVALEPCELAHAEACPDDVVARGVTTWAQKPWVILKPGVMERVARDVARAWVKARRSTTRAA